MNRWLAGAIGAAWPCIAVAAADPADPAARPALTTAGPEEPPPPKTLLYDGNYWGVLGGVVGSRFDDPLSGVAPLGLGGRVAGRFSTVTQFMDLEAGVEYVPHGADSGSNRASRLGFGIQGALHPAFPLLVFNNWLYDVVSGIHGFVGVSAARLAIEGQQAVASARGTGETASDWRPLLACGLGADIPISPRNRSSGWWLTARYALRWMRFGPATPYRDVGDGQFQVLLGWRSYDNSWARLPRPF